MRNIAIIFIGTGTYSSYFPDYYARVKKYFLPNVQKHFFVFTDQESIIPLMRNADVTIQTIEKKKWPYPTLLRFEYMQSMEESLKEYSHVIFIDADMYIQKKISKKEFCSHNKPLFGVEHPAFIYKTGTYETNKESLAAVDPEHDDLTTYFQACMFGGETEPFLHMVNELQQRIEDDLTRDVIAIWHDESHLNKYFAERPNEVHAFDPGYAHVSYSHHMKLFSKKILHLNKKGLPSKQEETANRLVAYLKRKVLSVYKIPLGMYAYYKKPRKTIVLVTGPMRSGTTLVKALLGQAKDVSHLPEIRYGQYAACNKYHAYYDIYHLCPEDIVVLKTPSALTVPFSANFLPLKVIVMERDIADCVQSIVHMTTLSDDGVRRYHKKPWTKLAALQYVSRFYRDLDKQKKLWKHDVRKVSYDELVTHPKKITKELFEFVGSQQTVGIDSYEKPRDFEWKWGTDDGGEKIQSLKVQPADPKEKDPELQQLLTLQNIQ